MPGFEFARRSRLPAHADEDIKQFAAVAARDGLHGAVQAAVRATGNFHAVMAQSALEHIRLAHKIK